MLVVLDWDLDLWLGLIICLDIQREERNVQKAIKDAAKRNDMVSAKVLFA